MDPWIREKKNTYSPITLDHGTLPKALWEVFPVDTPQYSPEN